MRTGRTIAKKGKEPTSGSETKTNKTQDPQDNWRQIRLRHQGQQ